jgi:hypothetical protein
MEASPSTAMHARRRSPGTAQPVATNRRIAIDRISARHRADLSRSRPRQDEGKRVPGRGPWRQGWRGAVPAGRRRRRGRGARRATRRAAVRTVRGAAGAAPHRRNAAASPPAGRPAHRCRSRGRASATRPAPATRAPPPRRASRRRASNPSQAGGAMSAPGGVNSSRSGRTGPGPRHPAGTRPAPRLQA